MVRGDHGLKTDVQTYLIFIERVGVFHLEFTHPKKAGPWACFVPEFSLYLVQVEGQIAVALKVCRGHKGGRFLMGGGENHVSIAPIFQGRKGGLICVGTPGFLP